MHGLHRLYGKMAVSLSILQQQALLFALLPDKGEAMRRPLPPWQAAWALSSFCAPLQGPIQACCRAAAEIQICMLPPQSSYSNTPNQRASDCHTCLLHSESSDRLQSEPKPVGSALQQWSWAGSHATLSSSKPALTWHDTNHFSVGPEVVISRSNTGRMAIRFRHCLGEATAATQAPYCKQDIVKDSLLALAL